MACISNFICEECMVGGQCISTFCFNFWYFSEKYTKFNLCIDMNSQLAIRQPML